MLLVLKLALAPLSVLLASLAARAFGHRVGGLLAGQPLIAGPIIVFVALEQGADFAAAMAVTILATIAGAAAHCLAFAHVAARGWPWWAALAAAWTAFCAAGLPLAGLPLSAEIALAAGLTAMLAGLALLPRISPHAPPPRIPRIEMALRMAAALGMAALIILGASEFGPRVAGVLLAVPITGSIMPSFTVALQGGAATVLLLRGFLRGLVGFCAFFYALAALLQPLGIAAAFAVAVMASLVASLSPGVWQRR